MADLTTRQRVFIEHYLQTGNATQAARTAGYAQAHSQGPRLLRTAEVRFALERRLRELKRKTALSTGNPRMRASAGYVYVLRADNGLIKIGQTIDVAGRLRALNTMLPYDLEVVSIFHADNRLQLERALHAQFAHQRIRGEWFDLSADDLIELEQMSVPYVIDDETESIH